MSDEGRLVEYRTKADFEAVVAMPLVRDRILALVRPVEGARG